MDGAARDDLIRAFLAQNDAQCLRCRYNLRGLPTARCPECGLAHELALIDSAARPLPPPPPAPKPWPAQKAINVAAVAHTTGAACWGTLAVIGAVAGLPPLAWLCGLGAAWPACARIRLALGRGRIERMDGVDRAAMAQAAWIWTVLGMALLLMLVLAAAGA